MITPETIIKSFKICGQVLDFNPDELLCMHEGRTCEKALHNFKKLVAYVTHQVELNTLEVLPQGIMNDDVELCFLRY